MHVGNRGTQRRVDLHVIEMPLEDAREKGQFILFEIGQVFPRYDVVLACAGSKRFFQLPHRAPPLITHEGLSEIGMVRFRTIVILESAGPQRVWIVVAGLLECACSSLVHANVKVKDRHASNMADRVAKDKCQETIAPSGQRQFVPSEIANRLSDVPSET